MNAQRWMVIVAVLGLCTVVVTGCAVSAGGYGYDGGVDVGVGYYGSPGYYGGYAGDWGPGYVVGPYRGDGRRFDGGGGRAHSYRPAPAGHAMPSIPSGGRGGGGRRR
jgi:hypothetical protein